MLKKLFLLFITATFAFAGGSYYRVVNVADWDVLNVRAYPSYKAKKTASLMPYDTGLEIVNRVLRNGSKWCDIRFIGEDYMEYIRGVNREHNWVNCKFLKRAHNIIFTEAWGSGNKIMRVVNVARGDVLYARKAPRASAKRVGALRYNDVGVIAVKCQYVSGGKWCYVAYDWRMGWASGPGSIKVPYAKLGWVNMKYLRDDHSGKHGRFPKNMMFAGEVY